MKGNTNNNINLIETTCKNTPNYDLCLSTLQSDSRTADITDISGLALVIVDAIKVKATLALDEIKKLQNSNPEYNFHLFECGVLYNAILKADVPEAMEGLIKGVPKFAEAAMDDAALEVRVCEQRFEEDITPLTDMNKAVYDLSVVAKSIIRLLL